jgi:hypothetical protein
MCKSESYFRLQESSSASFARSQKVVTIPWVFDLVLSIINMLVSIVYFHPRIAAIAKLTLFLSEFLAKLQPLNSEDTPPHFTRFDIPSIVFYALYFEFLPLTFVF